MESHAESLPTKVLTRSMAKISLSIGRREARASPSAPQLVKLLVFDFHARHACYTHAALRMNGTAQRMRIFIASLALTALVALADYHTGYEVRLAILYLAPVAFATWRLGALAGTALAGLATAAWLVTFESMNPYSHPIYLYWEGSVLCATLLITVWLLQRLRRALQRSDERVM